VAILDARADLNAGGGSESGDIGRWHTLAQRRGRLSLLHRPCHANGLGAPEHWGLFHRSAVSGPWALPAAVGARAVVTTPVVTATPVAKQHPARRHVAPAPKPFEKADAPGPRQMP
jgi:hypothetical protein